MRSRAWIGPAILAALVLITALIATGTQGADAGPGGFLAFRRFFGESGLAVVEDGGLPADGTMVLITDLRSEQQAGALLADVREGGRLLLADPASQIAVELGVFGTRRIGGFAPTKSLDPGCPLVDVDSIVVPSSVALLAAPPEATRCFDGFLIAVPVGRGEVLIAADASPFSNQYLRQADNASLAYQLVAPGPVVFGAPYPPSTTAICIDVWTCLPARARAVMWQIGIAVVVYALVRARRLGRPLADTTPAPIPAGELMRATGRLYHAAGAREHMARALRARALSSWSARLGMGRAAPSAVIARAAGEEDDRVLAALEGGLPSDDGELISLGRRLTAIDERIGR